MNGYLSSLGKPEIRSIVWVGVLTALSLAAGWSLKRTVGEATQLVEAQGVTAEVPARWTYQPGVGDLVLTARDAFAALPRYGVSRIEGTEGVPLPDVATDRNITRHQALDSFRIVEEALLKLEDGPAYRVRFAYVDDSGEGAPRIVEGLDYYLREGTDVLVVSLEANASEMQSSLEGFEQFRDSVAIAATVEP